MNTCSGCLGEGSCWVCLGAGRLPARLGARLVCHACEGSARCATCAAPALRVTEIRTDLRILCGSPA